MNGKPTDPADRAGAVEGAAPAPQRRSGLMARRLFRQAGAPPVGSEIVSINGSPVQFIFPGEPGFAATEPLFECDAVLSSLPHSSPEVIHVRD